MVDRVPVVSPPRTQAVRADTSTRARTIVIGLGNLLLGDDGVGWRVVDEVEALVASARAAGRPIPEVEFERLGVGGLRLMECLTGWASSFMPHNSYSAHDTSLKTALALGRRLGANLPDDIQTVTVQAHRTDQFSEELSPEVSAAVPAAARAVVELLAEPAGIR